MTFMHPAVTIELVVLHDDDLSVAGAPAFRQRIDAVVAGGTQKLILDFSECTFLDSVGIGVLIHARNRCLDAGATLTLRAVTDSTKRLLALTGLAQLFTHESAEAHPPESLPVSNPLPAHPDARFDQIAALTRRSLDVPVALVSLVSREEQVLPGAAGLQSPWEEQRAVPITHSICQYVVASGRPLVVSDVRQDPVLADNLAIPEFGVVAYAGIPFADADGNVLGTLCAIDTRPRRWSDLELAMLADLATACSTYLQFRIAQIRLTALAERDRIASALSEQVIGQLLTLSSQLAGARSTTTDTLTDDALHTAMATVDAVLTGIRGVVYPIV